MELTLEFGKHFRSFKNKRGFDDVDVFWKSCKLIDLYNIFLISTQYTCAWVNEGEIYRIFKGSMFFEQSYSVSSK